MTFADELEEPDEVIPPSHERHYYRSTTTGDLGFMITQEGQPFIMLDRPNERIIKPWRKHEWIVELEHRPMTEAQIAQVAFEADKKLCLLLGMHDKATREWMSLYEEQRIEWTTDGPKGNRYREHLYRSIMDVLAPLAG